MAVYKLFPEKDATVYSYYPAMNTGIDAILECNTTVYPGNIVPETSRALIKFDSSEISDVLTNRVGTSSYTAYFKLWTANVEGLNSETTLVLHATSGSWENGTGKLKDSPNSTNGVGWSYMEYSGSRDWRTSSFVIGSTGSYQTGEPGGGTWYIDGTAEMEAYNQISDTYNTDNGDVILLRVSDVNDIVIQSGSLVLDAAHIYAGMEAVISWFNANNTLFTASFNVIDGGFGPDDFRISVTSSAWLSGDGADYTLETIWTGTGDLPSNQSSPFSGGTSTATCVSASYEYRTDTDIAYVVTEIVNAWQSGTFPNDGFILKQSDADEFVADDEKQVKFKYFSVDTNTIYPPELEFRWDDYSFSTGSSTMTFLDTTEMLLSLRNNKGEYRLDSIQKFRINARPKYPTRVFQTASLNTSNYYLPEGALYAIKDLHTNEFVIPFDSSYTKISADSDSNYFTIYMNGLQPERYYQVLIKTTINGSTLILDEDYYFKVVNG